MLLCIGTFRSSRPHLFLRLRFISRVKPDNPAVVAKLDAIPHDQKAVLVMLPRK